MHGALAPATFADGEHLIVEGEPGDRYLIVVSGEIEVSQSGRPLGVLGPGAGVGEIALLRDVPRTASVRAMGPVSVFGLDRGSFLAAVCRQAAATVLAERVPGAPADGSSAGGG
jgi:CRP-like cAMP-binding protein